MPTRKMPSRGALIQQPNPLFLCYPVTCTDSSSANRFPGLPAILYRSRIAATYSLTLAPLMPGSATLFRAQCYSTG